MKQIIKLTLTSIIAIVMSVPGYAVKQCDIAVIDAGVDMKLALDKAVEALPEKATYNNARRELRRAKDLAAKQVFGSRDKIKVAMAHAKLNAPAERVKLYEDLEKAFDDAESGSIDPIPRIRSAISRAKRSAPAEQAKFYEDVEKAFDDLRKAKSDQLNEGLEGIGFILGPLAGATFLLALLMLPGERP